MRLGITVLAATALLGAGMAHSAEEENYLLGTAGDLAALCGTPADAPDYSAAIHMCQGFFIGVHHLHTAMHADGSKGLYCVPADARPSRNAVVEQFVAWVGSTPEAASWPAVEGVVRFAASAYPCE